MKYNKTFREALQQVRQIKEDGHTDVASAVRQCKTAIEDASQMLSKLQSMDSEGSLPSWWMNKIAIAADSMNKLRDYLLLPSTNESLKEQEQSVFTKVEVDKLNAEITRLKMELEQEKNKAQNAIPNKDTGEIPLQTGIAHAILKIKDKKQEDDVKMKKASKQIDKLARESLMKKSLGYISESDASDRAKTLGLDYMSFGRYGKDGKVTHKSIGGKLTAVDKDEKPIKDPKSAKPDAKPDEPKKDAGPADADEIKIKSRNFLRDLDNAEMEDDDGNSIELDFDDEGSFDAAIEKARSMGLDDVADGLESVGGYVMEMEPDNAQAEYQDVIAQFMDKPVRAVELSKKADEAIDIFTNQFSMGKFGIEKGNEFQGENIKTMAKDLRNTFKIVQKMVDSDESESNAGSGMSSPLKGFRPEVIETLQSLEDVSMNIEEIKDEIEDKFVANAEQIKDILSDIQGEIEFITDDSADHDGYTKPHKVNSAVESISKLIQSIKPKKGKKEGMPKNIQKTFEDIKDFEITDNNAEQVEKLEKAKDAFEKAGNEDYAGEIDSALEELVQDNVREADDILSDLKIKIKRAAGMNVSKESFLFSKLKRKINEQDKDEEETLTDKDLLKTPSLKDVIKQNLKKKLKLDDKKSKIEINPDVEIGVFSGGKNTPTGNLH